MALPLRAGSQKSQTSGELLQLPLILAVHAHFFCSMRLGSALAWVILLRPNF